MPNQPDRKESLQAQAIALREVVYKTAFAYKRSIPERVPMIDLGVFAEEAQKMRALLEQQDLPVASHVIVEHITHKLRLSSPEYIDKESHGTNLQIRVDKLQMHATRHLRQDKSVGLDIIALSNNYTSVPIIASLLIGEKELFSPAGVMVVTSDGTHLFFRTPITIEQSEAENIKFVDQIGYPDIGDFAREYQLAHFYCPKEATIATPVIF